MVKFWILLYANKNFNFYKNYFQLKSLPHLLVREIQSLGDFFVNPFPWWLQVAPGFIYGTHVTQTLDRV